MIIKCVCVCVNICIYHILSLPALLSVTFTHAQSPSISLAHTAPFSFLLLSFSLSFSLSSNSLCHTVSIFDCLLFLFSLSSCAHALVSLAHFWCALQMFQTLYGQTAAALYAKAAGQNAQARQLYNASADTYYKANDAAAYDDWVRARNHWDYFYNRS